MKAVLLALLALAACEHAEPTTKKVPPPPLKPDPVQQARAEFELVSEAEAAGTSKLYSRGSFLPASAAMVDGFNEGDFIGRLRTLFGPRDGDEYVFRDKQTGLIVTAYSGASGPSYGGAENDAAGREARIKADPLLEGTPPPPTDIAQYRLYQRHLDDAVAGPAYAAVIARLDALVSAVPPADWSAVKYFEDGQSAYRVGAKDGEAFEEDLPAADTLAWLEAQPKSAEYDGAIISNYLEHIDELAAHKPEAMAALAHLAALAKAETDPEMRELLRDQVKELGAQLR